MQLSLTELLTKTPQQLAELRICRKLEFLEIVFNEMVNTFFEGEYLEHVLSIASSDSAKIPNEFREQLLINSLRKIRQAKELISKCSNYLEASESVFTVEFYRGLLYEDYSNACRIKERSSKGGKNKKGNEGAIKQYIRNIIKKPQFQNLNPAEIAKKINDNFLNTGYPNGFEINQDELDDEIYKEPIIIKDTYQEYDIIVFTYYEKSKPEKEKKLTFKRLQEIIREIKNEKS